jgi:hypothetical protein
MASNVGSLAPAGEISIKVIRAGDKKKRAPLSWKLRNNLTNSFIRGWFAAKVVAPIANAFGVGTFMSQLSIKHIAKDGTITDYGVVSRRVVTTAGVTYIAQDFNNAESSADVSLFKFHGIGTTNTAEAIGDTALVAESTTALNPDNTRATGTGSRPSANVYQSVGTLTADASIAAVEHGIFTTSATGSGTLLDRSIFTVINLASGDSIQATYQLTLSAGG